MGFRRVIVEDVAAGRHDMPHGIAWEPGTALRRLIFVSNSNLIQSEALLVPEQPLQPPTGSIGRASKGKLGGKTTKKRAAREVKQKAQLQACLDGPKSMDQTLLMSGYQRAMMLQMASMLGKLGLLCCISPSAAASTGLASYSPPQEQDSEGTK